MEVITIIGNADYKSRGVSYLVKPRVTQDGNEDVT